MLVVFHLGWDRFDIDQKVGAANRKINAIARDKQAGNMMIFNLASLGAGEFIIDRKERHEKSRRQSPGFDAASEDAATDNESRERPPERVIDYIRRRHWRIARDLGHDNQFKAYRDAAEMLSALRTRGHQLAAVFTGASKEAEQGLKRARALDYFEEHVYGYDSLKSGNSDLTARGVYLHAMKMQKTAPADSIIVADSAEGIEDGVSLRPMALAGYLDPYLDNAVIDLKLAEMRQAGAAYAVVGGHGISSLPDLLSSRRQLKSTIDSVNKRLGL